MTKNSKYWRERFELLEDALNQDITEQIREIDRIYKRAQADIEKQIRAWYQRLAKNNEISMAEARKLLSADELEEFKWSVEDYIKHGEENALDQRWMKQLENASAKYKRWFKILPIIQLHSFFYKKAYYLSAGMNNLFYVKLSFCFLYKNMILREDGIII